MKTYTAKPLELERKWWLIDAEGQTLGRLATLIANLLRGKNNPHYTPHLDTGAFVIVINAEKIKVTGKKAQQKRYYRHTGYPGGFRVVQFASMLDKHPERILEHAVWGMLPHNTLGREQMNKLKLYVGAEHPHAAQKPQPYQALEVLHS